jgi:hypothetical protein
MNMISRQNNITQAKMVAVYANGLAVTISKEERIFGQVKLNTAQLIYSPLAKTLPATRHRIIFCSFMVVYQRTRTFTSIL